MNMLHNENLKYLDNYTAHYYIFFLVVPCQSCNGLSFHGSYSVQVAGKMRGMEARRGQLH